VKGGERAEAEPQHAEEEEPAAPEAIGERDEEEGRTAPSLTTARKVPSVFGMWRSTAMCLSADVSIELSYCSKKRARATMPSSDTRRGSTSGTPPRMGGIHHGLRALSGT
jgi:hypothetical protein